MKALKKPQDGIWERVGSIIPLLSEQREKEEEKNKVVYVIKDCLKNSSYMNEHIQ